jgi:hypothetical protein
MPFTRIGECSQVPPACIAQSAPAPLLRQVLATRRLAYLKTAKHIMLPFSMTKASARPVSSSRKLSAGVGERHLLLACGIVGGGAALDVDGAVLQQRHAVLRRDDHLLDGDTGQQAGQHLLAQLDVEPA